MVGASGVFGEAFEEPFVGEGIESFLGAGIFDGDFEGDPMSPFVVGPSCKIKFFL